jgi:hypothetical protein
LLEHERFEELASLAAVGELSPEEHEEFLRHKESCSKCREIVAETSSIAALALLAGGSRDEDPTVENERHRRVREAVTQRLPVVVPMPHSRGRRLVVASGVAAAFVLGIGLGSTVVGHKERTVSSEVTTDKARTVVEHSADVVSAQGDAARFQALASDLQKQIEQARSENRGLWDKLSVSDQHATELASRLGVVEQKSSRQAQDAAQARDDLNSARAELSKAQVLASSNQATIDALQSKLADREARLTEVTASLGREREMLSAGREVRDIMGARDLHIVDVIDRDGEGRPRKAFGRAFYTQGKSLIFYAFDLPAKNTADGKFVYAAWGSNSNKLTGQVPHSLGIFYNDDQTQHRWAMKFDNAKVFEEIDTVFVTLEPKGRPFSAPTGKPVLEAYFGTPPNHP